MIFTSMADLSSYLLFQNKFDFEKYFYMMHEEPGYYSLMEWLKHECVFRKQFLFRLVSMGNKGETVKYETSNHRRIRLMAFESGDYSRFRIWDIGYNTYFIEWNRRNKNLHGIWKEVNGAGLQISLWESYPPATETVSLFFVVSKNEPWRSREKRK